MMKQLNIQPLRADETEAFQPLIDNYVENISRMLKTFDWAPVHKLAADMLDCWKTGRQVFFCGNGGSGANATHMSNDFLYGISKQFGSGLRCHSLSSNAPVITCLANDTGYENVFSHQLSVMADKNDVLIVLSGSGNSPNILKALEEAKRLGMHTYGILGYDGGKAKAMVETPIHFAIDHMEISEDLQMIVANILKSWLYNNRHAVIG